MNCGLLLFSMLPAACAQSQLTPDPNASQSQQTLAPPSVDEKWNFFVSETATPMLFVAVAPDALVSQMTRSAPLYGRHFWRHEAFLKRIGATTGDDVSENFFSDFLLASALHEDTRYIRRGSSHRLWARVGYAISRAVFTRTDEGDPTFNWANVGGCAMSAALSNAYYPPVSRTPAVAAVNWGTNVAGSGLSNLLPEFGPDFGHWIRRHLTLHH